VFLNIGYRPVFEKLENTTFRRLDLFSFSGEGELSSSENTGD
jgi:hypothetical protein